MFEEQQICRSLKIKHFLLKPVQRLPQYKMLLNEYLKHIEKNDIDHNDTKEALQMISDLLLCANETI